MNSNNIKNRDLKRKRRNKKKVRNKKRVEKSKDHFPNKGRNGGPLGQDHIRRSIKKIGNTDSTLSRYNPKFMTHSI